MQVLLKCKNEAGPSSAHFWQAQPGGCWETLLRVCGALPSGFGALAGILADPSFWMTAFEHISLNKVMQGFRDGLKAVRNQWPANYFPDTSLFLFYVGADATGVPQCEWKLVFIQQIPPRQNKCTWTLTLGFVSAVLFQSDSQPPQPACAGPVDWSLCSATTTSIQHTYKPLHSGRKRKRRSKRLWREKYWHALWGGCHFFSLLCVLLRHAWRLQAI